MRKVKSTIETIEKSKNEISDQKGQLPLNGTCAGNI